MKLNRSLKEIHIPRNFCPKEEDPQTIFSPKDYFPIPHVSSHFKANYQVKTSKNSKSQKNLLNFSLIPQNSMASPKY